MFNLEVFMRFKRLQLLQSLFNLYYTLTQTKEKITMYRW